MSTPPPHHPDAGDGPPTDPTSDPHPGWDTGRRTVTWVRPTELIPAASADILGRGLTLRSRVPRALVSRTRKQNAFPAAAFENPDSFNTLSPERRGLSL